MKVHYINNYVDIDMTNRQNSVAPQSKIRYIFGALGHAEVQFRLVSTALARKGKGYLKREERENILFLSSIGLPIKGYGILARWHMQANLFFYLLTAVNKSDIVIMYHNLDYIAPVTLLRKLKRIKVILETNEIYSDLVEISQKAAENERRYIEKADGYIFSTEFLAERVNCGEKPSIINYGTYKIEKKIQCKSDDAKIHCVYAGTLSQYKGGAAAVAAAEFLDDNYHIHIIGFGNDEDIRMLNKAIKNLPQNTKCMATYDGLHIGENYLRFLQSCDIGLCTQDSHAKFNDTSFPSKILSYFSNGLQVVSVRTKVLENSIVSDLIYYCDDNSPENISKAIKAVNNKSDFDTRSIMRKLDVDFVNGIREMLTSM